MGNAKTLHSRTLRANTSKVWNKENIKKLTLNFSPKDHWLLEQFNAIGAENNIERFRRLIQNSDKSE